jgi:hypothetical protein
MCVIGDQRPCETTGLRLDENITKPFKEIIPVLIIGEYPPAFNSTNNYVMQGSGSIDASFSWHPSLLTHYNRQ